MTAASARQIGAIHAMAKKLRLDDDSYRDVLQAETGQRTAKGLSDDQAGRVIDRLRGWSNPAPPPDVPQQAGAARGALSLTGEYAPICRVLWIAGYNLGLIEDNSDTALVAFVRRQTKIAHLNWVRDGADAARVIEALKDWIGRKTGIAWEADKELRGDLSLVRWRKLQVIRAQVARLVALGAATGIEADGINAGGTDLQAFLARHADADLDRLSSRLGTRVRAAQAGCVFSAAQAAPGTVAP